MAITKTSTANYALQLCGASPIVALTDDTPNARAVNAIYDTSRKSVLAECKWNFATTRATLTITAVTIAWTHTNETYYYARPTDILEIFESSDSDAAWREEGDFILSDTADLGLKYVYDHDTPSKYPALFLDAFVDKLCANICFMLLNSATKAEAFIAKYEKVSLPKAMSKNSQTGIQQEPKDDEWERAKFGTEGNPARSYG